MINLPEYLYHGTSDLNWEKIQKDGGLSPRKNNKNSNWEHTVESRDDLVYLTNAYAFTFAVHACSLDEERSKKGVVLRIKTEMLDDALILPDEDAIEQCMRHEDGLTMQDRTEFIKENLEEYKHINSIERIGNCSYKGVIPLSAIDAVVTIEKEHFSKLIVYHGIDPSISVMNYLIRGEYYRDFTAQMFEDWKMFFKIGEENHKEYFKRSFL